MELLIALVIGLVAGGFVTYCCVSTPDVIELNPNDYTIPELLPMLKDHNIKRGFSVDQNKITLSWEHSEYQQYRQITVNRAGLSQQEFLKYWYENELNFYLKHKDTFSIKEETNE